MNDAQSHTEPIARKDHRCDYCNGIIPKGEKYNRDGLVYDGTATTWKSHMFCQGLVNRLVDWSEVDDGVDADYFHEMVFHECWRIIGYNPIDDCMTLQDMITVIKKGATE